MPFNDGYSQKMTLKKEMLSELRRSCLNTLKKLYGTYLLSDW